MYIYTSYILDRHYYIVITNFYIIWWFRYLCYSYDSENVTMHYFEYKCQFTWRLIFCKYCITTYNFNSCQYLHVLWKNLEYQKKNSLMLSCFPVYVPISTGKLRAIYFQLHVLTINSLEGLNETRFNFIQHFSFSTKRWAS